MKRAVTLGLTGLLFGGCAVIASKDEYSAYRSFRYETNADRRTALGAEYMQRYPEGRFRSNVQAEVGRQEEDFWEDRRSTLQGLQAYLQAFPNGSHAGEARARVEVYEAERRRAIEAQQAAEQAERERLAAERRAANERQRLFARNTILFWLRQFGSLDGWGEPIATVAQRNPDFNTAFGGEPAPICRAGRCRKSFRTDFFVPQPGRSAIARTLSLSLDLLMRERRIMQAQLVMHRRGLSVWYECETQGFCDPSDAEARQRSVRWAMDQLKGIVATAFPEARETPPELVGPEPEMEGAEEDEAAAQQAAAQPAPPIPPQPLGVQWSYIVGCGNLGGAQITIPENANPAGWSETTQGQNTPVRSCLRIDAYSAPDIEGVSQDEGIRVSWIPSSALPHAGGGARPARPARGHR
jgi:hypothetical protein